MNKLGNEFLIWFAVKYPKEYKTKVMNFLEFKKFFDVEQEEE